MKTIREILEKITWHSVRNEDGTITLMVEGITPDQAIKEIEELLLGSLPKEMEIEYETIRTHTGEVIENLTDDIGGQFYNQALEDTRKAIKSIIRR